MNTTDILALLAYNAWANARTVIAKEIAQMRAFCVAPTASRVTLGVMNRMCLDLSWHTSARLPTEQLCRERENRVARLIHGAPNYRVPQEEADRLLRARWL